MPEQVPPSE